LTKGSTAIESIGPAVGAGAMPWRQTSAPIATSKPAPTSPAASTERLGSTGDRPDRRSPVSSRSESLSGAFDFTRSRSLRKLAAL